MENIGGKITKKVMKYIYLLTSFVTLFTCLSSCDAPLRLLVNEKENHVIHTKCGSVNIEGTWFMNTNIKIHFNGKYEIFLDSIRVIGTQQKYDYKEHISFAKITVTNEYIDIPQGTSLTVTNGTQLILTSKERPNKDLTSHFFDLEDKLLLLQNAIYCNGKAIPIDTIKIEGTFYREKRRQR